VVNDAEILPLVEAALEKAGRADLVAELRRLALAARAGEVHRQTMDDVTRALLGSEKTLRILFSHELDPMSLFDPATGALLDVNDAWVAAYGYSREEALGGLKVMDVSAEPEATKAAVEHQGVGGAARVELRWHRAKDGTVFPVELSCGRLRFEGRDAAYAVMRDITKRDRAQRALERSEASFRALIESMPDGVMVHRHDLIVYVNPAGRAMLGYGPDEDLRGKPAMEIVHPDYRPEVMARVREVFERGTAAPVAEQRLLRKDGTSLVAEIAGHNTMFDGEPSVLAIARDVTQRKEIEAQLVMADRLASLGRLSASIGHELNNPLGYILGNVALLERELARADVPREVASRLATHVQMVKEGATRMRDIVHDLKTLARGDGDQTVVTDVTHILDVCLNMTDHELRGRARVVKAYGERVLVRGAEGRLGQVFLNILLNAAQAIPAGDPERNEVRVAVGSSDEHHVEIRIEDTGVGVPPENKDRIFEPFFTTKEGVGTGLGLSISHRIVTSVGGSISVDPRQGGGAVFRVRLPSAEADAHASAREPA
jgi:two-component system NtrC family sensor kinase